MTTTHVSAGLRRRRRLRRTMLVGTVLLLTAGAVRYAGSSGPDASPAPQVVAQGGTAGAAGSAPKARPKATAKTTRRPTATEKFAPVVTDRIPTPSVDIPLDAPVAGTICRTYDNEWWHFEYLATSTCPARQPTAAG